MIVPTDKDISTITDMREKTLKILQMVQNKKKPTIIMYRNSPKAILLSVKRYNQLMDMLEDYLDEDLALELEQKAKKAKKSDYIPMQKVFKDLNINV